MILDAIKKLLDTQSRFEYCVLCKQQTNVPKNLHIDYRDYYVEGAGQLCEVCWKDTYKK